MIYLFDKSEILYDIVMEDKIREADYEEQIKGAGVFRATIPPQSKIPVYVAHRDIVNPQTFMLYKVIRFTENGDTLTLEAIESAYDDLKADGFVSDYRPNNQLVKTVSDTVLNGSRWRTGAIHTSKVVTTSFYYESRLNAILAMISMGLEVRFRVNIQGSKITDRYVDWYDQLGTDRGKRYVHGGGLLKVEREEARSEIYTALIGRGKGVETFNEEGEQTGYGRRTLFTDVLWTTANGDPVNKPIGQSFVEIPERTAEYGYPDGKPRIGILELEDISDPEELLEETYKQLEIMSRPLVTYSADVRDEGTTGLGDVVAIIRGNIRYKTRIYKRTVDLLNPHNVRIELGDKIQPYTVQKLSELNTKIDRKAKEVRLTAFEQVKAYVKQAEMYYWGENGYNYDLKIGNEYDLPAGLYSFDTPIDEPYTKWIYFGAGKLVVSNHRNPDGSWEIKNILDGDGLAANIVGAEQVIAGSLNTNHITLESGETLTEGLSTLASNVATNRTTITAQGLKVTSHEERLEGLGQLQEELQQAVQGGGRNLLSGTATDWIELHRPEGGYFFEKGTGYKLEVGKTYTFAIEVEKVSDDTVPINLHLGLGGVTGAAYRRDLIGWTYNNIPFGQRISLTYTVKEGDFGPSNYQYFAWRLRNERLETTIRYRREMLQHGTIATDYRRSPEDIEAEIAKAQATANEAVTRYTEIEAGEIILGQVQDVHDRVDTTEASIAMVEGALETRVTTDLLQDQLVAIDNSLQGKASASDLSDIVAIQSIMQQTQTDWGVTINQLSAEQQGHAVTLQDVQNYMRFSTEGLEVGHSDSTLSIQITNEAINFIDGGEVVAYITGQTLYINSVTVLSVLQAGNHVTSAYGTDGRITIERWANG